MKRSSSIIWNLLFVICYLPCTATANNDYDGLLIVTHPDYQAAADTLAAWRQQMGYTVTIASEPAWTEEQIMDTTHHYVKDKGYDFVCFLGDIDKVTSIKYWHLGYLSHSTDLYFVCVDGPNDYWPDAGHGRISIADADQAMTSVLKIINYERDPVKDPAFYQKAVALGQFQGSTQRETAGYAEVGMTVRDYLIDLGYDVDKIFETESFVDPTTYLSGKPVPDSLRKPNYAWDGDADKVAAAWNDGRFFMAYRDHGQPDYWQHPEYGVDDVALLTNGKKLPIVLSICCTTGQFYQADVLGFCESLIRHPNGGAVGAIGSQLGNGAERNNALMAGLIDAIWPSPGLSFPKKSGLTPHEPIYEMGRVINQGKKRFSETLFGVGVKNEEAMAIFEKYHYHGDPTTKIWTEVPKEITANHPDRIANGSTTLSISNITCPTGIATLWNENTIIARGKVVDSKIVLDLREPIDASDYALLTITQHNYRPYQTHVALGDAVAITDEAQLNSIKALSEMNVRLIGNELRFSIPAIAKRSAQFQITTMAGQIVYSEHVENISEGSNQITLSRTLSSGMYMLIIKSDGKVYRTSVLKQ